ncbi:MAG TPA: hypothetical protein VFH68_26560 [Polyangia bacterium]|nr:hypothetical protein [Polyangia bacterium]
MTSQGVSSTTATTAGPSFVRRHRVKIVLVGLVGVLVGAAALWTLITLTFSYSDGDRIGYVQKFSRKGWICRTWEGELAMTPVPGAVPQMFYFTVRDDVLAKQIAVLEGKKVALHYEEKKGIPSSCFGDTSYFITAVRALAP